MKATKLLADIMWDISKVDNHTSYRALFTEFHGICDFQFDPKFSLGTHPWESSYTCPESRGSNRVYRRTFHGFWVASMSRGSRLVDPRDIALIDD